ncbi:MAG: hypothetical protein RI575_11075 [Balneolaceae bacterium]|nr:hypothetical protein [Balneolaceae bacterium]MDR9410343.1 hypothetical protein [Balneolaceae bacterium]
MTKKELALSFKLVDITTDEFAILEDSYTEGENVRMGTFVNFYHDSEQRILGAHLKFQFEQNEKPFLVISATCGFQLEESAWESLFDEDGQKLVIPVGFASHMAVITVGTIRGILYEKTKDTPFTDYIIPPINLTDLIKEDVEIEFEPEE